MLDGLGWLEPSVHHAVFDPVARCGAEAIQRAPKGHIRERNELVQLLAAHHSKAGEESVPPPVL